MTWGVRKCCVLSKKCCRGVIMSDMLEPYRRGKNKNKKQTKILLWWSSHGSS